MHNKSSNNSHSDHTVHSSSDDHKNNAHGDHDQHSEHDHSDHAAMFKRKFFISLIFGIPILIFSPMMGKHLPFTFTFPGSNWLERTE